MDADEDAAAAAVATAAARATEGVADVPRRVIPIRVPPAPVLGVGVPRAGADAAAAFIADGALASASATARVTGG